MTILLLNSFYWNTAVLLSLLITIKSNLNGYFGGFLTESISKIKNTDKVILKIDPDDPYHILDDRRNIKYKFKKWTVLDTVILIGAIIIITSAVC